MGYSPEELSSVAEAVERLGSQRKAAKELGLSRRALQRRLYEFQEDKDNFLEGEAQEVGFDPSEVNHYWIKTKTGSFHVKRDTEVNYNDLRNQFLEEVASYAPKYEDFQYHNNVNNEHLLVVDVADAHFGKLAIREETGGDYNLEIATNRFVNGVRSLLDKSRVHGIDRIVFVIGNDAIHADNPFRTTTAGTKQDTDGQWWQWFKFAKKAYISCIEELAKEAPVHLVFCPSNHDYQSGWMLADSISSWFENHPNVENKDGSLSIAHRKYIQYGENLIGFTHGDGAKENQLPNLMQYEARVAWGQSKYAYWYTHHLHSKDRKIYGKENFRIEKDHTGVTVIGSGKDRDPTNSVFVEIVRSPSEADGWHDRNGYKGNAAVECFLHHKDFGQTARFTQYF